MLLSFQMIGFPPFFFLRILSLDLLTAYYREYSYTLHQRKNGYIYLFSPHYLSPVDPPLPISMPHGAMLINFVDVMDIRNNDIRLSEASR